MIEAQVRELFGGYVERYEYEPQNRSAQITLTDLETSLNDLKRLEDLFGTDQISLGSGVVEKGSQSGDTWCECRVTIYISEIP